MKKYLILFIVCISALTIFLIYVLKPPSDLDQDTFADNPQPTIKKNTRENEPKLHEPIVDQKINRIIADDNITNLKDGFARVKIKFTKEFKEAFDDHDIGFNIVIYKDHQEIYRAEKTENQYLDLPFKMEDTYHFYIFLGLEMSYIEHTIQDQETIVECHPKKNTKRVVVNNDLKILFTDFRLGAFSFNNSYSFRWLNKSDLNNIFDFYPGINFPTDFNLCQMAITNENGYFTFNKSFEDIYNDKPLEVNLIPLKEINIKVIQKEDPMEYQLNFIPDKFIQFNNKKYQDSEFKISSNSFFTNCEICKIELKTNQNNLSKIALLKDTFTQIEFNLLEEFKKSKKVIIKNNPYGENLRLYCYYDRESDEIHYLGRKFGKIEKLELKSAGIYQFQNIIKGYDEILFFDVIDMAKLKTQESEAEGENKEKVPLPNRACFLGANFFKGNSNEVIEIDFAKQKYFNINLKTYDINIKPMYLISLNEKYVQELKPFKKEEDGDSNFEYKLLLKQGKYRVFSYLENANFFISQNFDVNAEETIQLTNDFNNIASAIDSIKENDSEKEIDGFYVSYKQEIPLRISLFQILKNLNCGLKVRPNFNYTKQDISLFLSAENGEDKIYVNFLDKDSSFENTTVMNAKLKYFETKIDANILQNAEILFHKSFAPIHSEFQIINFFSNFGNERLSKYRRADDNFKKHIFLSNFDYLILPPMNKPKDKIQVEHYGNILIHFSNPNHHIYSFEILDTNNLPQNTSHLYFNFFDSHLFHIDNITNGSCFEFNFLEFGTHQLEVSNLTTGVTYKYPFQVTEKYQEIDVK